MTWTIWSGQSGGGGASGILAVTETSGDVASAISDTVSYHGVTALTAARTKTLPATSAMADGDVLIVKDESGAAGTYNITVARAGSDTIDGQTSVVIGTNYGSVILIKNGAGKWFTLF